MNNELEEIIKILKRVPNEYIYWGDSVSKTEILGFECRTGIKLPLDYVELLKHFNGINLMGACLLGIPIDGGDPENLESVYDFEHYESANPMPLYLIPFSPDGGGNHYCFDTRNDTIVFWNSEYDYSDILPEIVYNTLAQMMRDVFIEWTIKEDDDISYILD